VDTINTTTNPSRTPLVFHHPQHSRSQLSLNLNHYRRYTPQHILTKATITQVNLCRNSTNFSISINTPYRRPVIHIDTTTYKAYHAPRRINSQFHISNNTTAHTHQRLTLDRPSTVSIVRVTQACRI
jgi:hypothetical protein